MSGATGRDRPGAAVRLVVTAGPHAGKEFAFDGHDTFLVGRSKDAHLQLSYDDPYFSRRHFLVEVNPPRVRVLDLGGRNGTFVNGERVEAAELKDGDEVRAGHTVFKVHVPPAGPDELATLGYEPGAGALSEVVVNFEVAFRFNQDAACA